MSRRVSVVLVAALAAVLAACSGQAAPSKPDDPDRTVAVTMSDEMRYSPDRFEFFAGETVRFTVTNSGFSGHEFFIGDIAAHEEHAAEMRQMANQPMRHDEPGLLVLNAGASGTLDYTFDEAGKLQIGCHEPGHYQAEMVADVVVHPAP